MTSDNVPDAPNERRARSTVARPPGVQGRAGSFGFARTPVMVVEMVRHGSVRGGHVL
jgi:hypothetical protein